jgi:dethiobiotin synthetase
VSRPARLVVVVGTGTEVGKTWVACSLLEALQAGGAAVAARKPAQSFASAEAEEGRTDADLLARATGDRPPDVCPLARWYPAPMAPPMAADAIGAGTILLDDLLTELTWPDGLDVGLLETAGGARSPMAHDGDGTELARRLAPDLVLLVADAGLGTLHAVRSAVDGLTGLPLIVLLNRFDASVELHERNRAWLAERDGLDVVTAVEALADRLLG